MPQFNSTSCYSVANANWLHSAVS